MFDLAHLLKVLGYLVESGILSLPLVKLKVDMVDEVVVFDEAF